MSHVNRRSFLRLSAHTAGAMTAFSLLPPSIRKALAIPADYRTGTLQDVKHIVVLMQENRSFDHYFGTMAGVRGFGDPFPIPLRNGRSVWTQNGIIPPRVTPFHLNTEQDFAVMRVEGTPHSWPDAQLAWDHGRMSLWPLFKTNHSMGYFTEEDIPFQFAMANAFTLCDAYHCSFQGGTNPNRLFHWTGSNGAPPLGNGPAVGNSHDSLEGDNYADSYDWTTYPERLEAAGISWQIYQNTADNFSDNPLAGFKVFRDAHRFPGSAPALEQKGIGHRDLDLLREDVLNDRLPQVSWIVATAEGSEHPGPSSPAQGADYTSRVLEALTANPEVWSRTVFIVNFDENDGFFDHMPPPAVPSYSLWTPNSRSHLRAGDSTVDTSQEYHHHKSRYNDLGLLLHRPYGLGPRVPMYVLSPWTRGGWVCSQVFDHTSVLRFIAARFGVDEPNISPWRRAVCGDLTTAFNFADPNDEAFFANFPETRSRADRTRQLGGHKVPPLPGRLQLPQQATGIRPSRALPYALQTHAHVDARRDNVTLTFVNEGDAAAVFHVYNRRHLLRIPRRYTVEPGKQLQGTWYIGGFNYGHYDLWVLGPNGYHRHFIGKGNAADAANAPQPEITLQYDRDNAGVLLEISNSGPEDCHYRIVANAYIDEGEWQGLLVAGGLAGEQWFMGDSGGWYDFTVVIDELPDFQRRFAGRVETGKPSISDPRMGWVTVA